MSYVFSPKASPSVEELHEVPRKKRWLILSYFSKVDGMACAQHIDDRIPHLIANGIEPVMLTSICGGNWPDLQHKKSMSMAPSGIRFELRHLRRKGHLRPLTVFLLTLCIYPLYLLEKLFLDLDSQWSWFPIAYLRALRVCQHQSFDYIYSTGGPPSAHIAAGLLTKKTKIPWVAELQDPLVHADWHRSQFAYRFFARVERFICSRADKVIFMTNQARINADSRTGLGEKGVTIYPGANPLLKTGEVSKSDFLVFAHFGSLGGSRNLKLFLEALEELLTEQPDLKNIVRFKQFGTTDALSRQCIMAFPYKGIIENCGRIPRAEAVKEMFISSVLVVIQNTEDFSSETIPSKVYEYLQTGNLILGMTYRNQELDTILKKSGHYVSSANSKIETKEGILSCFQFHNKHNSNELTYEHSVSTAVKKLLGVG